VGQKVHPNGFRLGVIKNWSSVWYAKKADYAKLLHEDLKLRAYVKKRLYHTGIAQIDIERAGQKAKVHIYTSRPGLVIGQRGQEVEKLRMELEQLIGRELLINIHEVLSPELSAQLVAESIASQIERPRRQGNPYPGGRALERRRDCPHRAGTRRQRAAAYPAGECRLWRRDRAHHLWHDRRKGLALPRRC